MVLIRYNKTMKFIKIQNGYILRFDKNDKFMEQLTDFADSQKIKSAWLSGFGAVLGAEIGWYDLEAKDYNWVSKIGIYEISNLTGNISRLDGKPYVHAHVTLCGSDYKAFGGHIKELVVGATLELQVSLIDKTLERRLDEGCGLNILDL